MGNLWAHSKSFMSHAQVFTSCCLRAQCWQPIPHTSAIVSRSSKLLAEEVRNSWSRRIIWCRHSTVHADSQHDSATVLRSINCKIMQGRRCIWRTFPQRCIKWRCGSIDLLLSQTVLCSELSRWFDSHCVPSKIAVIYPERFQYYVDHEREHLQLTKPLQQKTF